VSPFFYVMSTHVSRFTLLWKKAHINLSYNCISICVVMQVSSVAIIILYKLPSTNPLQYCCERRQARYLVHILFFRRHSNLFYEHALINKINLYCSFIPPTFYFLISLFPYFLSLFSAYAGT